MALTFPTPPAPPTPPQAPRVVLEGGGSVTEMPRPKSYGPKTGDDINEQKAKDAVAKGSGALSKTTTTKDDSRNTNIDGNINQAADNTKQKETVEKPVKSKIQETPREARESDKYLNLKEFEEDKGQTQATTQSQPFRMKEADTSHGVLYWGFTIISVLALLIYLARKFLINNSQKEYSFSKRDLSYLAEEKAESVAETPPKQPLNVVKNYETQKIEKTKPKEVKSKPKEQKQESGHFEVRV